MDYFRDVHSIYTTICNVFVPSTGVDSTNGGVQRVDILWTTFVHN